LSLRTFCPTDVMSPAVLSLDVLSLDVLSPDVLSGHPLRLVKYFAKHWKYVFFFSDGSVYYIF
jgi:hypothetical protein